MCRTLWLWGKAAVFLVVLSPAIFAQDLLLQDLVADAMQNSPVLKSAEARAASMATRASQEASPMDPMLSVGYQNMGIKEYNYGETPDAQWMFSLEQTFPFPGKLSLQEEAASLEASSEDASAEMARRMVVLKVTEAFYDLHLATRELRIIESLRPLSMRLEEAALARYGSGAGSQEDVLMSQAEKYMLLERLEMAAARKEAAEAMIRGETGTTTRTPLGAPVPDAPKTFPFTVEALVERASRNAPELLMRERLIAAAEKKLSRSKREALPDVTLMAKYSSRGGGLEDMYELTASVPLPVFYRSRQGAEVEMSTWNLAGARSELDAARARIAAEIRDNLAMLRSSERIAELYEEVLIPKARQDIDAAIASFSSGRIEASMALAKLKAPFEYELALVRQQVQREKAIARITAYTGDMEAQE